MSYFDRHRSLLERILPFQLVILASVHFGAFFVSVTLTVFSTQEGSWNFRIGCGPLLTGVLLPPFKTSVPTETTATALPVESTMGDPDCPPSVAPVERAVPQMFTWIFSGVGCRRVSTTLRHMIPE